MFEVAIVLAAAVLGGLGGSAAGLHLMAPHVTPEELEATKTMLRNIGVGFIADTI